MIIAFSGPMGSGKSTAIEKLKKCTGAVELVKFAGPLYDIQEYIYERVQSVYKRPESFIKDRKLLQWIGTEWGRETISDTVWVDLWKAKIDSLREKNAYTHNYTIVCDDLRFDNEAEVVHSKGGHIVQIICDKTKNRVDTTSGLVQHKSEAGLNPKLVDYTITNNGTIAEFELAVRNVYGLINHKQRNGL